MKCPVCNVKFELEDDFGSIIGCDEHREFIEFTFLCSNCLKEFYVPVKQADLIEVVE